MGKRKILLTGVTGYIGGRLLPLLLESGHSVRCLTRRADNVRDSIDGRADVVAGDVLDRDSIVASLQGIDTAYYLVHSMGSADDFESQDRIGARNFAEAAAATGVSRIVYLGGLGDDRENLSSHLRSRHEVGDILRSTGIPVTEFRASIVIGSGSLSFEMVRALVERLPVMIMPKWVGVPAQPIAVGDVLAYLEAALDDGDTENAVCEIGGTDVTTYGDIMREYARQRGLRRLMLPVPVLTPYLSSLWLGLVTPLFARVGAKLVASICNPTIVREGDTSRRYAVQPMGLRDAIAAALRNEDREFAATRWSDSVSALAADARRFGGVRFGNRLIDVRERHSNATAKQVFAAVEAIGGTTGWYYADFLWQIRGWLDLLVGGAGMRRQRAHPSRLARDNVVDCWRVAVIERPHLLRLQAEMKLPGRAWLEFRVREDDSGCVVQQTATFDPIGFWGLAYWYAIYPLHNLVFRGMLNGLVRAAEMKPLPR
ncbi:MAG: hypothetical protein ACI8TX_002128 [Hyphomicrobiaceae bacterium]|jgi:uncharacterized protein YbjT (DUF2867 family)